MLPRDPKVPIGLNAVFIMYAYNSWTRTDANSAIELELEGCSSTHDLPFSGLTVSASNLLRTITMPYMLDLVLNGKSIE